MLIAFVRTRFIQSDRCNLSTFEASPVTLFMFKKGTKLSKANFLKYFSSALVR